MSAILAAAFDQFLEAPPLPRLNLGCNDDHKVGYWNVDQCPPADQIADLRVMWPWKESSVDEIRAVSVFEHIDNIEFPANKGKIWVMNESHRVLKPGGRLCFDVPTAPSLAAFCDPTHVSFWTEDDWAYFCIEAGSANPNDPNYGERGRLGPSMRVTAMFKKIKWQHISYNGNRTKLSAILEAIK
jgi:SAM-dependent methyltransferase